MIVTQLWTRPATVGTCSIVLRARTHCACSRYRDRSWRRGARAPPERTPAPHTNRRAFQRRSPHGSRALRSPSGARGRRSAGRQACSFSFPAIAFFCSSTATFIPVCPTCSHDHDHDRCATELHGFAVPLIAAAAVHSFLDGWSIATAQIAVPLGIRVAVPLAIALHKAPEGIALGGVLRASMHSRAGAFGWCAVAQGATLLGGALGLAMAPRLGSQWITYPLGLAGGWLAYLGYHAVHKEWRRKGSGARIRFPLAGMAGPRP